MSSISFANVYLLFIAIPILAVLAVPFFIAIKKDNRNGHNVASMVLHVLMALLIAFAAAGTQIVTVITETDVYAVADVSYSANKNLDAIDGYLADLSNNLPRNSKLGVVCFGKDYKVTTQLGRKLTAVKDSGVDDSETNITEALEYTASLFKEGVMKRIVLITDGRQTYSNDPADLVRTVSSLQAQGIKVDAIYLNDNIDMDNSREVQISGVEYTSHVYKNRTESAVLSVQSSFIVNSIITLYKDGEEYAKKPITLSSGLNEVSFNLDTSEEGTFSYRAEIEAEGDECSFNNVYSFNQSVTEAVNVLVISSTADGADKAEDLYGENTSITHFDLSETTAVPVGVEELCLYDEIILNDVDVTRIDNYEMFLTSLNTVVSSFGKGLMTFGNLYIQDKTEGELKLLDEMLPVRYGDVNGNPKLYTLVMDVSFSMQYWSRAIIAKQAAAQLVNFLSDDDYVCIVAFGGEVQVALTPTSLSSTANREEVLKTIEDIYNTKFGQGTFTSIGMKKALDTIRNLNFSEKQVMLISDGLAFDGEMPPFEGVEYDGANKDREYTAAFTEQMRAYNIYTSVLQVGGGNEGDRQWMKNLVVTGGGTYYLAETEDALADVLFKDISQDLKGAVVTEASYITVEKPRDEVLEGEELETLKSGKNIVTEYILSNAKSSASNILTVSYKVGKIYVDVPLYTYWNYGNGKVASYTGTLGEIKAYGAVLDEATNGVFFKNVASTSMPAEKITYPFNLSASLDGKLARVELTPARLQSSAFATITITDNSGKRTDNFIFDSSIYYYEFITPDTGSYHVEVTYTFGENDYTAETYVTLSYPPEYDAFEVYDASVLYKMVNGNGTVSEDGKLVIENDESEITSFEINLTLPFLAITVILFVVDIIIRKLKWNDIVSLFGGAKGKRGGK